MLLDVEGTTTPVTFVTEVLFPFARRHVSRFIAAHGDRPDVRADLEALRAEHAGALSPTRRGWGPDATGEDMAANLVPPPPGWTGDASTYVLWLMDRDRKSTGLKSLQGKIWEDGYRSGEIRGAVYPDVRTAFERWRTASIDIAIFSSGSVLAQRLLFEHSTAGDLTPFIRSYFDTTTGPKLSPGSYGRIAENLASPCPGVLFVSDVAAELDAAAHSGLPVRLCVRDGRVPPDAETYTIVTTFGDLY